MPAINFETACKSGQFLRENSQRGNEFQMLSDNIRTASSLLNESLNKFRPENKEK